MMLNHMLKSLAVLGLAVAGFALQPAQAQDTVKVGVILPFSGQFAKPGEDIDNGIKLYMQQHGDTVAGKKIEVIRKDVGGISPDTSKRLAQELIVRDGVDVLAGFLLTPNAMAAAGVSDQAKKFMVIMNAATSIITTKSPYVARVSVTTPQLNEAFGEWAAKQGIKSVYTLAADYAPGHDAEQAFQRGFKKGGGTIIGSDRSPVANPDFAPFVQRIKDAKPEAVYVWIPGGAQPPALGKALAERDITSKNTKILGQGEVTSDEALESLGDAAAGIITTLHYDVTHDSDLNRKFVDEYTKLTGRKPSFFSVGGYDGMHLIYETLKKTGGSGDPDKLIEAAKGMAWESPRGPISIDPETRDIVQDVYIREVRKHGDGYANIEFDKIEKVKDPVLEGMKKK